MKEVEIAIRSREAYLKITVSFPVSAWPDEHDPRVAATATWCKVSYANKEKERQYQLFGFWVANEKDEEHIVPMGDPI